MGVAMRLIIILHILLALTFSVRASGGDNPGLLLPTPDAFFQLIGGPNEAVSVGPADVFINPALLPQNNQTTLQFSNLLNSNFLKYMNASAVLPLSAKDYLGMGVFGINIPVSQIYDGQDWSLRYQENYQLNFVLSYARQFSAISAGVSLKYLMINSTEPEFHENIRAWEGRLGLFYKPSSALQAGIVYQKTFPRSALRNLNNQTSRRLGMGLVWQPPSVLLHNYRLYLSWSASDWQRPALNYGLEVRPFGAEYLKRFGINSITLRSGVGNFNLGSLKLPDREILFLSEQRKLKFGAGIEFSPTDNLNFGFDFCFPYSQFSRGMNMITTRINL